MSSYLKSLDWGTLVLGVIIGLAFVVLLHWDLYRNNANLHDQLQKLEQLTCKVQQQTEVIKKHGI